MSDDPRPGPEIYGGPVLGPDGRLERPGAQGTSADVPAPAAVPLATPAPAEAGLELQARPPREPLAPEGVAPFATPTPHKRRGSFWVFAVLLSVAVFAAYALKKGVRFGAEGEVPVVMIDSDPSGAEIRINGELKGNTPILFQNRYPGRPIPLELRAPGFRTWTGTFGGGQDVRLQVKLQQSRK